MLCVKWMMTISTINFLLSGDKQRDAHLPILFLYTTTSYSCQKLYNVHCLWKLSYNRHTSRLTQSNYHADENSAYTAEIFSQSCQQYSLYPALSASRDSQRQNLMNGG